jgi:hypothetical protein
MSTISTNTLDGGLGLTDPVYAVSNLSSLFTVCALALNGVGEYREDIRERALDDIRLTMVLSARLADDAAVAVERAIAAAKKGGEK